MKYLIIPLLLAGCGPTTDQITRSQQQQKEQKKWEEVSAKGCEYKIPGKFRIIDKNSGYYKCEGTIEQYPYLSNHLVWLYYFSTLHCGKNKSVMFAGYLLTEDQIKRTGNLADTK
jgi:hypothetical protein